jgi:16S rRNA processing protein RimM
MTLSDRLLLGVIAGPRGIKGEMKVKSFTGQPEDIAAYGTLVDETGETSFKVKLVGMTKGLPVIRIKGVVDRNQAEALKGQELYISRDKLPKTDDDDEFYYTDLIGLTVQTADGDIFGKILRLENFGAGDVLEIQPEGKGAKAAILIPFTKEMVPTIDIAGGFVVIDLPDDFFVVPKREDEEKILADED